MVELLKGLFEYDYWANGRALASLDTVTGDGSRARRFLGHVIGAQRVWLSRFETPESPSTEPWPTLTLDDAQKAVGELRGRWAALLGTMTPEKLAGDLVYHNTKGQEFKTPIKDVLLHLVMHSVYHRGQVAAAVRDSGGTPASTDYIAYVRQLPSSRPA
jgi:uncharacterized damage-inducible protein DinB